MSVNFAKARSSESLVTTWRPEPDIRGTWSILSTCIITTALCVWTAVHLNVPADNRYRTKLIRKILWLAIGLFAPEMLAYTAWYQRLAAADALKELQLAVGGRVEPSFFEKFWSWISCSCTNAKIDTNGEVPVAATKAARAGQEICMAHAFYAGMGGVRLDISDPGKPILPRHNKMINLTAKGVAVMLKVRPQLLEDISLTEILDKSKASPVTKALVCWQACWFCLQCLGRLMQSSPVSLLELNTFAHCVFALIIYIQWWNKPQDVDTPTIIKGDIARELAAWMSMYTPMDELGISNEHRIEARRIRSLKEDDRHAQNTSTVILESRAGTYNPSGPSKKRDLFSNLGKVSGDWILEKTTTEPYPPGSITLRDGDELLSTGLCYYDEADATPYWPSWGVTLTPTDQERWKCAASLFKENPPSGIWSEFEGLLSFDSEVPNWPPLFNRNVSNPRSTWVLFLVAGFLYGGLHALPWNTLFRSNVERILWQLSTSIIIGFGPLALCSYLTKLLYDFFNGKEWRRLRSVQYIRQKAREERASKCFLTLWPILKPLRHIAKLLKIILGAITWASIFSVPITGASLIPAYGFARIYLIVECFISLSYAEPGVFKVPSWSAYLPHIT